MKNPGKYSFNQEMNVNIISDVTWLAGAPWYVVTRQVLHLSGILSKSPQSQSNHEKNNKQNQTGENPTWYLDCIPQDC